MNSLCDKFKTGLGLSNLNESPVLSSSRGTHSGVRLVGKAMQGQICSTLPFWKSNIVSSLGVCLWINQSNIVRVYTKTSTAVKSFQLQALLPTFFVLSCSQGQEHNPPAGISANRMAMECHTKVQQTYNTTFMLKLLNLWCTIVMCM